MLVFDETCLTITQVEGHKMYGGESSGPRHTLEVEKIVNTKQINSQTFPMYSQDAKPYTLIKGQKPPQLQIEGVLCLATEVDTYLATLAGYRTLNTLYNAFLPCSVLTCVDNGNFTEVFGSWIVNKFTISRSVNRRSVILFTLVIDRKW